MKQRVADALQILGAVGLVVAAGAVSLILGLLVGAVLAIIAGVVLERS
jgi:hypothetical protein